MKQPHCACERLNITYIFLNYSSINLYISSLFFLDNGYTFPFLAQTLPLHLLYDPTSSLLAFFYLFFSQRYKFTCETLEEPISWLLPLTFLLPSLYPKSPTSLLLSSLLLFSPFLVFSFFSFALSSLVSFLLFASTTEVFPTLAFTIFHIPSDTLSSLLHYYFP